jgi:hypothetical protein
MEATEKIIVGSSIESGDCIISKDFISLSQAQKFGDKLLKQKNIYSIWIHQYEIDEQGDALYQWKKYENDSKWSGGNYW